MISSFLIALREGVEASLIVGILLASYQKSQNVRARRMIWLGVLAASLLAITAGALLTFTSHQLSTRSEEYFAGITSLVAVALVTAMVFWLKRTARGLKRELTDKLERAAIAGSIAIFATAFLAVIREGLETSLFLFTNAKIVKSQSGPLIGLIAGLVIAIVLGSLIYRRAIQFNLTRFFQISGSALLIVAAGVLTHAISEFQSLGILHLGSGYLWDWSSAPTWLTTILEGTIGIGTSLTALQGAIWVIYLLAALPAYLHRQGKPTRS